MCLSVPANVLSISSCKRKALVEVYGLQREVFLAFDDCVAVGDVVLVHGTIALCVLEAEAAAQTMQLLSVLREPAQQSNV